MRTAAGDAVVRVVQVSYCHYGYSAVMRHLLADRKRKRRFIVIKPCDRHREVCPDRFIYSLLSEVELIVCKHTPTEIYIYGYVFITHVETFVDSSKQGVHGTAKHVLTAVALHITETEIPVYAQCNLVAYAESAGRSICNMPYIAHQRLVKGTGNFKDCRGSVQRYISGIGWLTSAFRIEYRFIAGDHIQSVFFTYSGDHSFVFDSIRVCLVYPFCDHFCSFLMFHAFHKIEQKRVI